MSGQGLRIVPYAGTRLPSYLDGWKVNGKRKRLYFKDEAAAAKKLAELAKQQKKEGQAGLDVPLELRVMGVKAARRPSTRVSWTPPSSLPATLNENALVLVSAAIEAYLSGNSSGIVTKRHLRDIRRRIGRFNEAFGNRPERTISVREIEDWLHGISLGPESVVNYRAVWMRFLNIASNEVWSKEIRLQRLIMSSSLTKHQKS